MHVPIFTHIYTYNCQSLKGWGLYLCPSPPPNNPHRKVFHFALRNKNKRQKKKKNHKKLNNQKGSVALSGHAGESVNERGQTGRPGLPPATRGRGVAALGEFAGPEAYSLG